MFNDIIQESQRLNFAELIQESVGELRFNQSHFFLESSIVSLYETTPSHGMIITEADTEGERKGIITRLIEVFKKMITKIKDFFDRTFKITQTRLNRYQKILRKVDYSKIEVETYSNINSFGSVLDRLKKASAELKNHRINSLDELLSSMSTLQKGVEVTKAIATKGKSLAKRFEGYVPSLSQFNHRSADEIRAELIGEKKVMKGVHVDKFYDVFLKTGEFKTEFDEFSKEYTKILNTLNTATKVTDKLNMLGPNPQHMFNTVVHYFTSFFNRNVHLIANTALQIMSSIVSTASAMVIHAKVRKGVG